jgi:hypothetical protein
VAFACCHSSRLQESQNTTLICSYGNRWMSPLLPLCPPLLWHGSARVHTARVHKFIHGSSAYFNMLNSVHATSNILPPACKQEARAHWEKAVSSFNASVDLSLLLEAQSLLDGASPTDSASADAAHVANEKDHHTTTAASAHVSGAHALLHSHPTRGQL